MDVSKAQRLKGLEEENARLKKLLADQMLEAAALRELLSKNGRARRQARCRRAPSGRHEKTPVALETENKPIATRPHVITS